MERTRKQTVLKQVKEKGKWVGYIAPNKVNVAHIENGWHIGNQIIIKMVNGEYVAHTPSSDTKTPLEIFLNNFALYNCNSELGNRIAFWNI